MRALAIGWALVAGLGATTLRAASDEVRFLIEPDAFEKVSAREQAGITAAICDGKAEGTHCDTCPESSPAGDGFTLDIVIPGHFRSSASQDALVTIAGCEEMHASIGWGFLVTRRGRSWEALDELLGMDLRHCRGKRFQSGRDLLVCEGYQMESFELMHGFNAVFVEGRSIRFRNLMTATDTTRLCDSQDRVQTAEVDKIEFRDLNGDGIEDVSFTASLGSMRDTRRRQAACQEAQDRKPGARGPVPRDLKTYRIDYLFDGQRFTLAKESEAAAKLFRRPE